MNHGLTGGMSSIFQFGVASNARQVKCIKQSSSNQRHERITHIGGDWGANSKRIIITEKQAIKDIRSNAYSYYVKDAKGDVARVEIIPHPSGKDYLKTVPDYTKADNLLLLPTCT